MSATHDTIAATVVLFNPVDNVFDEISSYVDQVGKIYVIDNSVVYNATLVERLIEIDKVVYFNNHGNKGIAAALNRGAELALEQGFNYLLTMDQDTSVKKDFVGQLMAVLQLQENADSVGIIAPRYTEMLNRKIDPFEDVLWTMTSGNILSLQAYKKAGPFMEELFIDHVDHEYCLRLKETGFNIVQANKIEILHRPGNIRQINFFWWKKLFSSHSPKRLYYFCRNGFYVARRYRDSFPQFRNFFFNLLLKEICKIALEKNKMDRLKKIIEGILDYRANKFGAYNK